MPVLPPRHSEVALFGWQDIKIRELTHSTPVLPHWHVKDPGHSAKSTVGRLQLNMHTPVTHRSPSGLTMLSLRSAGTYQGIELTSNSSGNAWPESSQFAEPLWTDFGLKSCIGVRELISTFKQTKKSADGDWLIKESSSKILVCKEKLPPSPPTQHHTITLTPASREGRVEPKHKSPKH